jgi:hypothetical protein
LKCFNRRGESKYITAFLSFVLHTISFIITYLLHPGIWLVLTSVWICNKRHTSSGKKLWLLGSNGMSSIKIWWGIWLLDRRNVIIVFLEDIKSANTGK